MDLTLITRDLNSFLGGFDFLKPQSEAGEYLAGQMAGTNKSLVKRLRRDQTSVYINDNGKVNFKHALH